VTYKGKETSNAKKRGRTPSPSVKSIKFALLMYKHLISEQRYTISVMLRNGMKRKEIAEAIGVSPSTITRELQRNSGSRGKYNWERAQANATYHKHRSPGNRAIKPEVKEMAMEKLTNDQWSPRQISGRFALDGISISHETIYRMIRKDKANGGELYRNCRHGLKHRNRPVGAERIKIPNRNSIHDKPREADGSRFGDLEMDTIVGKGNKGAIVTIIERKTGWLWMRKLPHGKSSKEAAETIVRLLEPFKDRIKTIVTDNGVEFFNHEYITKRIGVKVYFADPHAPWQKGGIENTNALIRQYIPKGTDFNEISQQRIKMITIKINNRPREKLAFSTPQECFYRNFP
jgi:IS30 family transposase